MIADHLERLLAADPRQDNEAGEKATIAVKIITDIGSATVKKMLGL